jgi:U3 small nucleolar RNA-associated protein 10
MASYMSFMLEPFIGILKAYSTSSADDDDLWFVVIECLTKSFNVDEGGMTCVHPTRSIVLNHTLPVFWREDKLRQISPSMIEHVIVGLRVGRASDGKTKLSDCLCAMTACVNDDTLLKSINLDILMHTRSEDLRLRLFALTCAEALWRAHGGKLVGTQKLFSSTPTISHDDLRFRAGNNQLHSRMCRRRE